MDETLSGPEGLDIGIAAAPMVQLTVGAIYNTDISIRFWPSTTIEDVSFGLFGIGIKHDVKQWIPAIKDLPFHGAVFLGLTTFDSEVDLAGTFTGSDQIGIFEIDLR